ncbi:mucin-2-like [Anopheles gambiae]|uniref:mucin-2-like n=1 Tax=Anopheles gambiae TaxID=7165 RepID=UPI002AC9BB25|nr:mucin-2-like [Anopheles gambiae]
MVNQSDFAKKLREAMSKIRPSNTAWHTNRTSFVHSDLNKCSHVFVRNDTVRPALTTPYHGPYQVLTRNSKSFQILLKGHPSLVSVDRLKPAYTTEGIISSAPQQPSPDQLLTSQRHATPVAQPPSTQQSTMSQRLTTPMPGPSLLDQLPSSNQSSLPDQQPTATQSPSTIQLPSTNQPPIARNRATRTSPMPSLQPARATTFAPPPPILRKDQNVSTGVTRSQRRVVIPLRYR